MKACGQMHEKFILSWHKDIRIKHRPNMCLDVADGGDRAKIMPYSCHGGGGNQLWKFDVVSAAVCVTVAGYKCVNF